MNLAIIGCGYVAELYALTLRHHPDLRLVAVFDRERDRRDAFAVRFAARACQSLDELLALGEVSLVLNLTNPRSHFEVTKACLEAGRHVYSEKPLAMTVDDAAELVALAERKALSLSSAPCSVLGESAQTMWKAIRDGAVGKVRLVYANFDDGMIAPFEKPWTWTNSLGVPWPAKDEFETGCTYEHAGYVLTWLGAFFGPARAVTSFASCQVPDKGLTVSSMAPDFTVACIDYPDEIVARVTCGLVGPRDKSLTVIGDDGVLFVGNVRDDRAPVYHRPRTLKRWHAAVTRRVAGLSRWLESCGSIDVGTMLSQQRLSPITAPRAGVVSPNKPVDFMLGPSEMADAILNRRQPRLSAGLGVHIVELIESIQYPSADRNPRPIRTTFDPIDPMPWAR